MENFLLQSVILVGLPALVWRFVPMRSWVPLVVIQIVLGITLGPSVLGHLAPDLFAHLFNAGSVAILTSVASLAVLFFAFVTGLHYDPQIFAFYGIGLGSVAVPVLFGVGVGWYLVGTFPEALGPAASRGSFAFAMGICMGVTALPVLAALLRETGMITHRLGQQALAFAIFNDIALWLLLAVLLANVAGNASESAGLAILAFGVPAFFIVMLLILRPLLTRLAAAQSFGDGHFVLAATVALAAGCATSMLGLHFVLGAFIAGAIMPDAWRKPILERIEGMTAQILMPFFFMATGLKITVGFSSDIFVTAFTLACIAAVSGKMIGTVLPARFFGESWPDALTLGAFMQTKGLLEVVVLTILLDAKVIGPAIFSAMVLTAVVTTCFAAPLAAFFQRKQVAQIKMAAE